MFLGQEVAKIRITFAVKIPAAAAIMKQSLAHVLYLYCRHMQVT
jgi:hypothetical protein